MARVAAALQAAGLNAYTQAFEDLGYDDVCFLCSELSGEELAEVAEEAAMEPGDARRFVRRFGEGATWRGDVNHAVCEGRRHEDSLKHNSLH